MKNVTLKLTLLTLLVIVGISILNSVSAQSKTAEPKIYAIINRANWCPVCQANGDRIMKEVMPACKELKVKFLANDLTDAGTIEKSTAELKKNNLYNSVKEAKSTGVILLIDATSKKVIKEISVANPSKEIIKEITTAQS
jgi:hypothetical protein